MKRTDLATEAGRAKFFDRVERAADGCWIWTGAFFRGNYGRFKHSGHEHVAHRVSYELARGPIQTGLQLDHLCRNRRCVNPDHLEPVTARENQRRGETFAREKALQTHCLRDHPLSGANLFIRRNGSRRCQRCEREGQIRLRATPAYRARHAEREQQRRHRRKGPSA